MCGIVALWGASNTELVDRMLSKIRHRGPDGQETVRLPNGTGTLGHQRLAIIDPANGRQPMHSPDGRQSLIVNGMIYNYRSLRSKLGDAGFTTDSDSETILHGYRTWGRDVVTRLDGMFAFALSDDERIIAARDPLGIKPLYFGQVGDATAFASEIQALDGLADDISEFPAGHIYDSRSGFERYYTIPGSAGEYWSTGETLEAVRSTLEAAVRKRLRSDVPLGCFLSGGLDSSLIAAIARQDIDELHTFSVGLDGSTDLDAAREVAVHLGTIHHERVLTQAEAINAMPEVVRHLESYDRDLVRNAVPTWFVAREAASADMKVILTGEGADEIFAGYGYYEDYASDPRSLQRELRRSLESLHDMNLQRVDRMTMAHGIEARVPFLDTAMVDVGMRVDPQLKQSAPHGRRIEKWVLRKSCEDLLPAPILWREKEQFADGSGFGSLFGELSSGPTFDGRTEESYYRDVLAAHFQDAKSLDLTTHWRDNRLAVA